MLVTLICTWPEMFQIRYTPLVKLEIVSVSSTILITRKHNPGAGLKALPGGFMDPVQGSGGAIVAEKAATAALPEATEETGIGKQLLETAQVIPLGHRSYNRPFDIRVA